MPCMIIICVCKSQNGSIMFIMDIKTLHYTMFIMDHFESDTLRKNKSKWNMLFKIKLHKRLRIQITVETYCFL